MNIENPNAAAVLGTPRFEQEADERGALWTTLVAELRSKLSAMEATGQLPKTVLDEPLLHEFYMTVGDGCISVWLNTDTGKGSWNAITKHLDMAEPWLLSPEGAFEIDGETMNLPAAAERFIAKASGGWIGQAAT